MTVAEVLSTEVFNLKDLVRRHKVCFESYPIWHVPRNGGRIAVGYELDLIGTHDHPQHAPASGCAECSPVYRALLHIAKAILPPNDRASRYAIQPFDVAIHFSPRRKWRRDVVLAIDIMHRDQFDRPIDECETHCLREMTSKLKELGARPGRW